jgi:hypothetical protein
VAFAKHKVEVCVDAARVAVEEQRILICCTVIEVECSFLFDWFSIDILDYFLRFKVTCNDFFDCFKPPLSMSPVDPITNKVVRDTDH